MQIHLDIQGTPDRLRRLLADVQNELGDGGEVLGSINAAGDESIWRSIPIEIHGVDSLPAAIRRIQPSVRVADPERNVVVGGSTSIQQTIPPPDWPRSS